MTRESLSFGGDPDLARAIDRACDRFAKALQSGAEPRIEDFLATAPVAVQDLLLQELLHLELEACRQQGRTVPKTAYLTRFPTARAIVDQVFAQGTTPKTSCAPTEDVPLAPIDPPPGAAAAAAPEPYRPPFADPAKTVHQAPLQDQRQPLTHSLDSTDRGDSPADTGPCGSPTTEPMSGIPTRIGRFTIQRELGRGGFAVVYLAHDPQLQRDVAIKVPRHKQLLSATTLNAFLQEARAAARLKHPGLVVVYDVQQDGDVIYIVQEYIDGQPLSQWAHVNPPSPERIVVLIKEVVEAVGFAHQHGLVHRDLKPANLLIDQQGHVHVADFGLALNESLQRLRKGEVCGTPAYMSPEQVRGRAHILDGRSDLWSIGVILYELLTGRRPFGGANPAEVFEEVKHRHPKPPRQIKPEIPAELERICLKCLTKRQTDRYSSAVELLEELEAWTRQRSMVVPTVQWAGQPLAGQIASVATPPTPSGDVGGRPASNTDENVQVTVFRPKVIAPARWYPLIAFAHLSELPPDAPEGVTDPITEVRRQAEQSLGALAGTYGNVTQDAQGPVPREGELTFVPEVPGVEFNPRRRTFVWQEVVHREEFRLRASAQCEGQVVRGRLTVFLGAILLAEVSIGMRVESRVSAPPEESNAVADRARRFRRVFASYSPEDAEIVAQCRNYARAVGDEFCGACSALWLPAQPDARPEELIRQSDVFQLFWSWNSMRSPAVRQEWEYALSLKREGFVRPVYWEIPPPADEQRGLPPESLRRLGFQQIGQFTTGPTPIEEPGPAATAPPSQVMQPTPEPAPPPLEEDLSGLLDAAIENTRPEASSSVKEAMQALVEEARASSLAADKNVVRSLEEAVQKLDASVPEQREMIARLKRLQTQLDSGPELEDQLELVLKAADTPTPPNRPAHRLSRVRRPRAQIVYEMEEADGTWVRELPLVIGIMGNFSGDPHGQTPPEHRSFLDVDRDNFHEILRQINPALNLDVESFLPGHPQRLAIDLCFPSLEEFEPAAVARRVQPLATLLEQRATRLPGGTEAAQTQDTIHRQVRAILRAPEFRRLEASWRGLHRLVHDSETGPTLKIKVLDLSQEELAQELADTAELEQGWIFQRLYEEPLTSCDAEPFGVLLGDYEFSHQPNDVALLRKMAQLGSIAFCPFIAAASPRLCGLDCWSELAGLQDVETVASQADYAQWNALCRSEEARFVYLTVPRVLCRLPFDDNLPLAQELGCEEIGPGEHSGSSPTAAHLYCWGSAAYVLAMRLADSFAKTGQCLTIGGLHGVPVDDWPSRIASNPEVDLDRDCPAEVGLTEQRANQFLSWGLVPLFHPKHRDAALSSAFPSIQRLTAGLLEDSIPDAALTGQLPYGMAISRFAHYVMLVLRDKLQTSTRWEQCREDLERWVARYVSADGAPNSETVARFPWRHARVEIQPSKGKLERYEVVVWLQPWLPDQQLSHAQRITITIPCPGPPTT